DASKKCVADGKKEISIMTYPDMASGARLVQNDRADLMVTDLGVVDQLSHDNPTLYERGFKVISDFRIGVAVKKGNADLINAIYAAVRVRHKEGTQKGIFDKYAVDTTLIVDPELRKKAVALLGSVFPVRIVPPNHGEPVPSRRRHGGWI